MVRGLALVALITNALLLVKKYSLMEKIKNFLIPVCWILGIGLTILGYWHVNKKHSDRELSICEWMFPVATYHGLEYFWHDDFAGVDWNARNQRDMKMISYFLLRYKSDSAKYQLTKDMDEFSTDITKYPKEQILYLKEGTKAYVNLSILMIKDIKRYSVNYFKGDTSAFIYSDSTNNIIIKLKKEYYFSEDISVSVYDLNRTLHERLRSSNNSEITKEEIDNFFKRMDSNYENSIYSLKQAYKDIFKEDFK